MALRAELKCFSPGRATRRRRPGSPSGCVTLCDNRGTARVAILGAREKCDPFRPVPKRSAACCSTALSHLRARLRWPRRAPMLRRSARQLFHRTAHSRAVGWHQQPAEAASPTMRARGQDVHSDNMKPEGHQRPSRFRRALGYARQAYSHQSKSIAKARERSVRALCRASVGERYGNRAKYRGRHTREGCPSPRRHRPVGALTFLGVDRCTSRWRDLTARTPSSRGIARHWVSTMDEKWKRIETVGATIRSR
jgi:hypothetical protein